MDRRAEAAAIIQGNLKLGWAKEHYFPNLSNKDISKIVKCFDSSMDTNSIAAFIDTSMFFNCGEGMVFTLQGIYYKGTFEKTHYFNYSDVVLMRVLADKKGRTDTNGKLDILLENKTVITIEHSSFDVTKLRRTIELLKYKFQQEGQVAVKRAGVVTKQTKIPDDIKKKCHVIIHASSAEAGAVGVGFAQIPLADNAIITPIQIKMIVQLGAVFEIRVTESVAKGILATCATTIAGRGISQILWGWIPGLGNAINTATAAGITEVIGWIAAKHLYAMQQEDAAKHRMAGMKAGYEAASAEYEAKLRKQANEFIQQIKRVNDKLDEYNKLCDEYAQYIIELESRLNKTQAEVETLKELKRQYEELVRVGNQHH